LKDTYNTITEASDESFFKEKGSKFFGYAFPIWSKEDAQMALDQMKKKHPSANHICYAWQLGIENPTVKLNDDGEPSNSAGSPIHGQIRSFDLTYILVASVRYFGGTKLGVGGLKQAYKHSAMITLQGAAIVEKTADIYYQLNFNYDAINLVMRIIKEKNIRILSQQMGVDCIYRIAVRKGEAAEVLGRFSQQYQLKIQAIELP